MISEMGRFEARGSLGPPGRGQVPSREGVTAVLGVPSVHISQAAVPSVSREIRHASRRGDPGSSPGLVREGIEQREIAIGE